MNHSAIHLILDCNRERLLHVVRDNRPAGAEGSIEMAGIDSLRPKEGGSATFHAVQHVVINW